MIKKKSTRAFSEQLKDALKDLNVFPSELAANRGFNFKDLNDFIKRSEEVRKTFKDEDLIRLSPSK